MPFMNRKKPRTSGPDEAQQTRGQAGGDEPNFSTVSNCAGGFFSGCGFRASLPSTNPKSETNPNTKREMCKTAGQHPVSNIADSNFEFVSNFGLRFVQVNQVISTGRRGVAVAA
jgi:hypothetical protein